MADEKDPVPIIKQKSSPGQSNRFNIFECCSTHIRSFHINWITFFWCFFAWFCTTNISPDHFTLTLSEQELAGSLSITSTIIFRILIASLCPKYGSRICFVIVLICTMIVLLALALVQSSTGYIICHFFLGVAGASFVVSQYHTTRLFSGNIVGSVQGVTAGFGNFGGGVGNFIAPLIVYYVGLSWTWFLLSLVFILFLLCFFSYFAIKDDIKKTEDLSISFMNSAARISKFPKQNKNRKSGNPDILIGGFFADAFYDYRSWVLFGCYAASCGIELIYYVVAARYFQDEFGLNKIKSGLIVMIWSSINLLARPFGGYLCDKYTIPKRAKILFVLLFVESIFIILFGLIGNLSLGASIILSFIFSICIQMAEGATFSIVAFIQPKSVGYVIGIVASGANFGATFFMFIIFLPWNYSHYQQKYSWVVLGVVVMIISFCALMIQFTNRELHDSNQNMAAVYDLESVKTKQKINMTPAPQDGNIKKETLKRIN